MNRFDIAAFERVSFEQYKADCIRCHHLVNDETLRQEWEAIKLPTRATKGSAGYDFYLPYETAVSAAPVQVPTGIRCLIEEGWVLVLAPKSGLGFKYSMTLENTIGVVDADYANSDNEGHIQAKFHTEIPTILRQGQKFMQGIFMTFGVAVGDEVTASRNGGFGSTGEN